MKPNGKEADMSDLKIRSHRIDTPSGPRYWFDVAGPLDSCGHRHEDRIEAGACKRALIAATDLRGCIVCGQPTANRFFCPCDGHHPICEGNHADSVPRLDCAFIWSGIGHFTTRTGAQ